VIAVAARAGVNVETPQQDYGVDGTFSKIQFRDGRRRESGFKIDYQLKASKRWRFDGAEVVYDLEAKTYNDLVERGVREKGTPLILILLCLPEEAGQWLEQSEDRLVMRKCCYWDWLTGTPTLNTRTVTIRIPRQQLFTPDALTDLFDRLERGDDLL
jgi:hypothetical protein